MVRALELVVAEDFLTGQSSKKQSTSLSFLRVPKRERVKRECERERQMRMDPLGLVAVDVVENQRRASHPKELVSTGCHP